MPEKKLHIILVEGGKKKNDLECYVPKTFFLPLTSIEMHRVSSLHTWKAPQML